LREFRLIRDRDAASGIRERVSSMDERPVTEIMQQVLRALIERIPINPAYSKSTRS
jgi:hypothetical protein